jgi:cellulose biosynthesis protein BcsQ
MAKKIALFNHKGGVSKTTTTFNLGWMLASRKKKVILVDTDPQCNLTGMVLDYRGFTEFEHFYKNEPARNIMAGLAPAFESMPKEIEAVECIPVPGNKGLYLLPGHLRLSEYEVTLGIAQELSSSIVTLKNLPGSIHFLLEKTAEKLDADYVLIDMSPSLSSINQNLMVTSDFFIVPTKPDYFSVMAIDSLARILPKWYSWSKAAQSLAILKDADYPFPNITPKFLGTIVQNFRPRSGEPAKAFQKWIDEIAATVSNTFVPVLRKNGMMLPDDKYIKENIKEDYCLATIPDFNSLIAISQKKQTPVFALTAKQIGQGGKILERTMKAQAIFRNVISKLTDYILGLTSNAISN